MMRIRIRSSAGLLAGLLLAAAAAGAEIDLTFIPSTPAHRHAVSEYQSIWDAFGAQIMSSLERRTCMPFAEQTVSAEIADASSHSGGPAHAMRLRATYPRAVKQATLVHELAHRHLWQLVERLDDIDGHRTLYLILDRVWADVWGEQFADERIRDESAWRSDYDYATAWTWARDLAAAERERLWKHLLVMNGFAEGCRNSTQSTPA
jgi:hypothetical protein